MHISSRSEALSYLSLNMFVVMRCVWDEEGRTSSRSCSFGLPHKAQHGCPTILGQQEPAPLTDLLMSQEWVCSAQYCVKARHTTACGIGYVEEN